MKNIKWIVKDCMSDMLRDISRKKPNMTSIKFGTFDKLDTFVNCTQLQELTFGESFNKPIGKLVHCAQLQQLTFGRYYNKPPGALTNFAQLQRLTFGAEFNLSIEALSKCTQLQRLTFGAKFNLHVLTSIKNKSILYDIYCVTDRLFFTKTI